jgi:hypothetical protein
MSESLTITVAAGGEDADARAFSAVLQDVLDLLDSLAHDRYQKSIRIAWRIVALTKNSPPCVTLESKSRRKVASVLLAGLAAVQNGGKKPFDMATLKIAKRLGERIDSQQVDAVILKSGTAEFKPSTELASNADELIDASFYEMPSSVDGKLDIVNIHAGPRFTIFDDITNREIRCRFPESMLELVKGNLGKKITASGTVRFNTATDQPTSINVENIEQLEDGGALLTLEQMPVIDVTGGDLSPEQFIRSRRDGR